MIPTNESTEWAFPGSFFTTIEYAEVWGEDWLSLFSSDSLNPGYTNTAVLPIEA
jgi:hypothetical protein